MWWQAFFSTTVLRWGLHCIHKNSPFVVTTRQRKSDNLCLKQNTITTRQQQANCILFVLRQSRWYLPIPPENKWPNSMRSAMVSQTHWWLADAEANVPLMYQVEYQSLMQLIQAESNNISQVRSNRFSGKNKKHFFLNSLMLDDKECLMPNVRQLSKIQIEAVEMCETPHHQRIRCNNLQRTPSCVLLMTGWAILSKCNVEFVLHRCSISD